MVRGVGQLHRVADGARFTNNCSHFKFEVKSLALRPCGCLRILCNLTLWSNDIMRADDDSGGSSVIAYWEMKPVRL